MAQKEPNVESLVILEGSLNSTNFHILIFGDL
jgi:hypothetical protein